MNDLYKQEDGNYYFNEDLPKILERLATEQGYILQKNDVFKDNRGIVESYSIRNENSIIAATIYPSNEYAAFMKSDLSIEEYAQKLFDYVTQTNLNLSVPIDDLTSKAYIESHLTYKILNKEMNQNVIGYVMHKDIPGTDLMLIPIVRVETTDVEQATFKFTKDLQENLKMTDGEVNQICMRNLTQQEFKIKGLSETILGLQGIGIPEDELREMMPSQEFLYVVSTANNINGAVAIANPELLKEIGNTVGNQDYYIIPSSLHEVLIAPAHLHDDPEFLSAMVRDVNAECVDLRDKLSDNMYFHDGITKKISICNTSDDLRKIQSETKSVSENLLRATQHFHM